MRFPAFLPWFLVASLGLLHAGETTGGETAGPPALVMNLTLNENSVAYIPTNPAVSLFIQFPAKIEDYSGRGFSEDLQQDAGDFYLRHIGGDAYLTVVPIAPNVRRTLHVVIGGRGYPLHFFPSPPDQAWEKVNFALPKEQVVEAASKQAEERLSSVARSSRPGKSPFSRPGPERLLGMITFMRMLANLPERQALDMVALNSDLTLTLKDKRQNFGDFTITTHFAVRNHPIDTVGFSVTVENVGRKTLVFAPNSFSVRAGANVYHSLVEDFDPILPPQTRHTAFFVISGDGGGGVNRLYPENDFRLSVELAAKANPSPVSTLGIPAPSGG